MLYPRMRLGAKKMEEKSMKKIFKYAFAVVASVAALAACTNEPEEGITPDAENKSLTVVASIGNANRTTFTDNEGLKWSKGDNLIALFATGNQTAALAEEEECFVGTFNFNNIPAGDVWFVKGINGGANVQKQEFLFKHELTQPTLGAINPEYIKLKSNTTAVTGEEGETIDVQMGIVGTMMRYIVYSGTGAYSSEKIQMVKLQTNEKISNSGAVIGYNFVEGKYHQDTSSTLGDECKVFYAADFNYILTNITTPEAIEATNAEEAAGKSVYMPVPPVSVSGYKYIVVTDKATYTFDASSKATKFNENELKNILLDLEKASERRTTKVVTFEAGIGDIAIEGEAASNKQLGYIFFNVDGAKAVDFAGNSHNEQAIYGSAQFFLTVWGSGAAEAGTPVDWVNIYYGKDSYGKINSEYWFMDIEENNTGATREAMVYCRITLPDGYEFDDGTTVKSFERRLAQYAAGAATNVTFQDAINKNVSVAKEGVTDHNIGYCLAYFNGTESRKWNEDYSEVIFRCISPEDAAAGNYETAPELDWITAEYENNGNGNITDCVWWITVQPNEGAERQAVVCCIWPDSDEFAYPNNNRIITSTITQAGAVEGDDDENVGDGSGVTNWVWASNISHNTGMLNNTTGLVDSVYFEMTSVTIDGKTYTGTEQIATLTNEQLAAITAKVFAFAEYTNEETAPNVTIHSIAEQQEMFEMVAWISGHRVAWYPKFNTLNSDPNGARRYVKIVCYNADGTVNSTSFFHQDPA